MSRFLPWSGVGLYCTKTRHTSVLLSATAEALRPKSIDAPSIVFSLSSHGHGDTGDDTEERDGRRVGRGAVWKKLEGCVVW